MGFFPSSAACVCKRLSVLGSLDGEQLCPSRCPGRCGSRREEFHRGRGVSVAVGELQGELIVAQVSMHCASCSTDRPHLFRKFLWSREGRNCFVTRHPGGHQLLPRPLAHGAPDSDPAGLGSSAIAGGGHTGSSRSGFWEAIQAAWAGRQQLGEHGCHPNLENSCVGGAQTANWVTNSKEACVWIHQFYAFYAYKLKINGKRRSVMLEGRMTVFLFSLWKLL